MWPWGHATPQIVAPPPRPKIALLRPWTPDHPPPPPPLQGKGCLRPPITWGGRWCPKPPPPRPPCMTCLSPSLDARMQCNATCGLAVKTSFPSVCKGHIKSAVTQNLNKEVNRMRP